MAIKSTEQSLNERLGSDCKMPIQGDFEAIAGLDLLLQDIQRLLLTIPGERVNRPDFGCALRNQVWENMRVASEQGAASIRTALDLFEPRITVTNVDYTTNENTGLITFNIQFTVNSGGSTISLIFPFRTSSSLALG